MGASTARAFSLIAEVGRGPFLGAMGVVVMIGWLVGVV